ncbi:hypothetical protein L0F63_002773 [Massospora cicadina]|nr:hypothetical protein L0F63_002773 [Massospora cicadina]
MLVPEMVRKLVPEARIGFFLHAPFPSSEIFRCLPTRKEILNGVLASNLIGLQTYAYARHFSSTCTRVLGLESAPEGIVTFLETSWSKCHRESDAVLAKIKSSSGRDKIDQATGLLQKFKTLRALPPEIPRMARQGRPRAGFVLPAEPSLPSRKESPRWCPISTTFGSLELSVHHFQHLIAGKYYGLLSIADVALITSVRDGMNTTSHEFVICQRDNFSPLILSEFTGTAGSLSGGYAGEPV